MEPELFLLPVWERWDDPADEALLAMIRSAQSSLKLSLQDIGPIALGGGITLSGWPTDLLEELARAVARGVDIHFDYKLTELDSRRPLLAHRRVTAMDGPT